MANPTNDFKVIFETACKLFEKNYQGMVVRLVGVTLQNLIDPRDMVIQMSFFDYEIHEEQSGDGVCDDRGFDGKHGSDCFCEGLREIFC